jgi:hypothetical protein
MNDHDFAIVIGIRRYPMLGKSAKESLDLLGPDRDAEAVYKWLIDPMKGGVPEKQATLIRSLDYPDPFEMPLATSAKPRHTQIEEEFERLVWISEENQEQGKGRRVGRRLYLYASGHGFARKKDEGALVTANATRAILHHVNLRDWANWFADSGYFDEVVLWMDACMIRYRSAFMRPGGFSEFEPAGGGGKVYAAFAARYPLQALEGPIPYPDGDYRGFFTYTLLKGLNGDAVDAETKKISGESLKRYLINAMCTFMQPGDLESSSVAKEPYIELGDDLDLCPFAELPKHQAVLHIPAHAIGKSLKIVTGSPLQTVETRVVTGTTEKFCLPLGQYFALIEELGWLHDIRVVGGDDVSAP